MALNRPIEGHSHQKQSITSREEMVQWFFRLIMGIHHKAISCMKQNDNIKHIMIVLCNASGSVEGIDVLSVMPQEDTAIFKELDEVMRR